MQAISHRRDDQDGIWTPQWTRVRKIKTGRETTDLFAFLTTEPQAYLVDVISRIVAGHPQSQLDDLLPWAYASQPLKAVA